MANPKLIALAEYLKKKILEKQALAGAAFSAAFEKAQLREIFAEWAWEALLERLFESLASRHVFTLAPVAAAMTALPEQTTSPVVGLPIQTQKMFEMPEFSAQFSHLFNALSMAMQAFWQAQLKDPDSLLNQFKNAVAAFDTDVVAPAVDAVLAALPGVAPAAASVPVPSPFHRILSDRVMRPAVIHGLSESFGSSVLPTIQNLSDSVAHVATDIMTNVIHMAGRVRPELDAAASFFRNSFSTTLRNTAEFSRIFEFAATSMRASNLNALLASVAGMFGGGHSAPRQPEPHAHVVIGLPTSAAG